MKCNPGWADSVGRLKLRQLNKKWVFKDSVGWYFSSVFRFWNFQGPLWELESTVSWLPNNRIFLRNKESPSQSILAHQLLWHQRSADLLKRSQKPSQTPKSCCHQYVCDTDVVWASLSSGCSLVRDCLDEARLTELRDVHWIRAIPDGRKGGEIWAVVFYSRCKWSGKSVQLLVGTFSLVTGTDSYGGPLSWECNFSFQLLE